jgi:hypothetical protein
VVGTHQEQTGELTGSARGGLEQQAFRNRIGGVLGQAGSVIVVDPKSGQRVLMNGPTRR